MAHFISGIDISRWQGTVNWQKVKAAGIQFVYIRALNGLTVDPLVGANVHGARSNGIPFGLYQWWQPHIDPIAQAQLIMKYHKNTRATMVPMIDVEDNTTGMRPLFVRRRLGRLITEVTHQLGKPPTLYTAAWFWNQSVNSDKFTACPLWVARYAHYDSKTYRNPMHAIPVDPAQWPAYALLHTRPDPVTGWGSNWSAWQFSAGYNQVGKRYGVGSTDLDLNILKASEYNRFLCK